MRKERARQYRKMSNYTAQSLPDEIAAGLPGMYREWSPNKVKYGGENEEKIVLRSGQLYRCITPHTSQESWPPEAAASLWAAIDVEHSGTIDDPIPARLNMEYFEGKHYTEDGTLYRCTRDSGQPLAYLPSQLVGHYFEVVGA